MRASRAGRRRRRGAALTMPWMEVKSILGRASTCFSSCSESFSEETVLSARSRPATALRDSRELLLLWAILAARRARPAGLRELLSTLRYAHPFMKVLPSAFAMRSTRPRAPAGVSAAMARE